jgi:toxin-antitoxin system PIN domain toxin
VSAAVLLDVNVLVAIAWPNHVHHAIARSWFLDHRSDGWATCPVTESGFVRISSNVKAIPAAVSPAAAIEMLVRLRRQPGHAFWPDDVSLTDQSDVPRQRLISHTQVTDAHLLALARRRGGRIATFDRGLVALSEPGRQQDVLLLSQLPQQRGSLG